MHPKCTSTKADNQHHRYMRLGMYHLFVLLPHRLYHRCTRNKHSSRLNRNFPRPADPPSPPSPIAFVSYPLLPTHWADTRSMPSRWLAFEAPKIFKDTQMDVICYPGSLQTNKQGPRTVSHYARSGTPPPAIGSSDMQHIPF